MRKHLIILFLLLLPISSFAATPVLFFSDIISGPATGIGDGLGSGVIVTVWGRNLGSSQGTSTIKLGTTTAAHVYYWKNANGSLPGGPADLYSKMGMQEIAFSIPNVSTGATTIKVTVDGTDSNTLPFTVRTGNIYHVKTTGNDSTGDGSWGSPWKTVDDNTGAGGQVSSGDTVYVHDGVQEIELDSYAGTRVDGNFTSHTSFIAYPNAAILAQGPTGGIYNYHGSYQVWSKWAVKIGYYDEPDPEDDELPGGEYTARGIRPTGNGRIIGCEVTDIAGKCSSGSQGAISTNCSGHDYLSNAKFFGNYIHDFGCAQSSYLEHTFYLSIRDSSQSPSAWDIGWNYLKDNHTKYGLHCYDETSSSGSVCGCFTGTVKIHDNYVEGQRGPGINVGSKHPDEGSVCWDGDFEIYNNVLVNCGLGPTMTVNTEANAIRVGDRGMGGTTKIYNNSIYSYADDTAAHATRAGIFVSSYANGGNVTMQVSNNILYDTMGYDYYIIQDSSTSSSGAKNILYTSSGGSPNTDSSLTNSITSDPLYTSTSTGDLSVTSESPAIDAGTTGLYTTSFNGITRSAYDIGAFEYIPSPSSPLGGNSQFHIGGNSTITFK